MSKYSILICSCDAYADAWPMFFHLLKANWREELPDIYLNTESKQYVDPDIDVKVLNVPSGKEKMPWGERLRLCLDRIDSEYILFLLEDYYFESAIRTDLVEKTVSSLENHKDVACFQFVQAAEIYKKGITKRYDEIPEFVLRPRLGKFKIKAGPSMWRKSDLVALTKKSDSPWEWEYFGSYRTYFYGKKFYCVMDKDLRVFDYDVDHGGAIHRGKWVGYKMKELEEKFNFSLDYGNRKIEEDWMKSSTFIQAPPPVYKRLSSVISNRIKIVTNTLYGIVLKGKKK